MLREIGIRNFVLIEDLRLELGKGLDVFTGETGAGKSIVFDALETRTTHRDLEPEPTRR